MGMNQGQEGCGGRGRGQAGHGKIVPQHPSSPCAQLYYTGQLRRLRDAQDSAASAAVGKELDGNRG